MTLHDDKLSRALQNGESYEIRSPGDSYSWFPPTERIDGVRIHRVIVEDPWKNERHRDISESVSELMDMGYYGDTSIDLERKRKSEIDKNNPATRKLIKRLPGFEAWLDTVPKAEALDPIYRPNMDRLPNGSPIDPEMSEWLKNIYDGIGIRSRAAVMKDIIREEVLSGRERAQWVSLASGAAQPVFESLSEIAEAGAIVPHVTLLDIDRDALKLADSYAREHGFGANITTRRANILRKSGLVATDVQWSTFRNIVSRMQGGLPAASYDMVDAVGILEYLKEEDWAYRYNNVIKTSKEMAGAVSFLSNAYELVRPGGILLVGNMRDTHPQLGFTLNTIQWPHIQPRSIDDMLRIVDAAGLDGEVDIYCPTDDVYALYAIRKPQ